MNAKDNSLSSSNSPDEKYYIKLLQAYLHSYLKKSIFLNSEQQNRCEDYYVVGKNWIDELKIYMRFDEIIKKLKEKKLIYILDDDERIKPIIKKFIKNENNLDKDIDVFDNSNLELIDSATYELIKSAFPKLYMKKVDIIYGKQKIIIELDDRSFLIKYKNNNSYDIILLNFEADWKDKVLKNILNKYIPDWLNTVGYDSSKSEDKYNIAEMPIEIKKGKNSCELFSLNELKFNFEKAVQKVAHSSYIISTMHILSIILLEHNLFENLIMNSTINTNNGIIYEFIVYMINLCENEKIFTPIDFLKKLKEITNKKFTLKKEIEPYIFYEFIINQICKEMNYNFPQEEDFFKGEHDINKVKDKLDKIYNNNSIIKTFFGVFEISLKCDFCNEEDVKLGKFNLFDIDIYDYISKEESCEEIELGRCLDYYFKKEIKMGCKGCTKKDQSNGERKIVKLPDYLVIRLNWGEFNEEKGFNCKDEKIKPFYNSLDNIEYIEIKKEFCIDKFAAINNLASNDNIKYRLFGTVDYIQKDQKRFFCKFRTENNKWFVSWCNSEGKKVGSYKDDFSSPCLFFYKKYNSC